MFAAGAGYKCYICSWSPASPNRTDICTRENFNRDAVKVYEGCPHGCESVAAYDLNGEAISGGSAFRPASTPDAGFGWVYGGTTKAQMIRGALRLHKLAMNAALHDFTRIPIAR